MKNQSQKSLFGFKHRDRNWIIFMSALAVGWGFLEALGVDIVEEIKKGDAETVFKLPGTDEVCKTRNTDISISVDFKGPDDIIFVGDGIFSPTVRQAGSGFIFDINPFDKDSESTDSSVVMTPEMTVSSQEGQGGLIIKYECDGRNEIRIPFELPFPDEIPDLPLPDPEINAGLGNTNFLARR